MKKSLEEQRDEEEGAALVPQHEHRQTISSPSPPHQDPEQSGDDDDDAHHHLVAAPAWWRRRAQKLVPTRGVGLVMAGLLVLALLVGSGSTSRWIHLDGYASLQSFLLGSGGGMKQHRWLPHHVPSPEADLVPIPFSCGNGTGGSPGTCRRRRDTTTTTLQSSSPSPSPSSMPPVASSSKVKSASKKLAPPPPPECPEYFRYIHSDLSPWRETGITREAVERGRHRAAFRLVVVDGRAYVETYHRVFQTRDTFTQWGIAQLLARYPGRVPDLDLMFDCDDLPVVGAGDRHQAPPPLFRYCGSETTLDIAFPDWSFWGWPELNIKPWEALRREINEENAMVNWTDRAPYAYWKGNPKVGAERLLLLRCNASGERDWNARVYAQDWGKEVRHGFRGSDLSKQCTHRYKIYIEGRGWSVSEKYILACDSVALMVRPRFHDFFSRGLSPLRHYWPVRGDRGMCRSIKYAVDWGNAHTDRAQEMAGNASRFIQEELTMDRVYDYMFHLLTEYARLLRYRPEVPRGAAEVTVESMIRGRRGLERQFMADTVVAAANGEGPCRLRPAYSAEELEALRRAREDVVRQVEAWEK